MSTLSLFALAVGLALDAAAVSAARGIAAPRLEARHFVLVAVYFGGFQALMPLLGWLLGRRLGPALSAWDHWIACMLLTGLGVKMIWESRSPSKAEHDDPSTDLFSHRAMVVLAIATSVDAFAVGVMLPMLGARLSVSMAVIGVTTAVLSMAGLGAGRRLGAMLGRRLDALGGAVLVTVGLKILFEHLTSA
jgi:putative Mn2+ efflux pump MntP